MDSGPPLGKKSGKGWRVHPVFWSVGLLILLVFGLALVGTALEYQELLVEGISRVDEALRGRPVLLLGAIAVAPTFGFPISVLLVAAGYAVLPTFGTVPGLGLILSAVSLNILGTYLLARQFSVFFRGLLEARGYRLPVLQEGMGLRLTLLVRIVPGVPLFVQNYLLGVIGVPIRAYLLGSFPPQWIISTLIAVGGGAALVGGWRVLVLAMVGLGLISLVLWWLGRRLRRDPVLSRAVEEIRTGESGVAKSDGATYPDRP